MGAKAQRLSKKELGRKKAASQKDPLQDLRRTVESRQGPGVQAGADNRGLVEYLVNNVNWSRLLPAIIPLVMSVLRGRQNAVSQATPHATGQALGSSGLPSGGSQPSLDLIGLVGSLLGMGNASPAQTQPQGDALGGLLQSLVGGQGTQSQPQADPLSGLLQTLSGGQGSQPHPQADALTGLLQTLSGAQGAQSRPQGDGLSGLLQALSGQQASRLEQYRVPAERGTTVGAQSGSVLRLLGAAPHSQRAAGAGPLFDLLANNMDLDGDGVPDVLEQMLGSQADSDAERSGATALLQGLLDHASAQDLTAFSRSVQGLLP
jgi:hypothetical protein